MIAGITLARQVPMSGIGSGGGLGSGTSELLRFAFRWGGAISTEYEIADDGSQVEILIRTTAEQEPRVIASLQDYASGACGCATNEYDRLESMDVKTGDGNITVRLQPLPGEHLDTDEIRACVAYTLTQAEQE
jgi:hypothetical protein